MSRKLFIDQKVFPFMPILPRRALALATALAVALVPAVAPLPALAQAEIKVPYNPPVMRSLFEGMTLAQRQYMQEELATAGLYAGGPDGAWGPGTERGLAAAAYVYVNNSYGRKSVDMVSAPGIGMFYRSLVSGEVSAYLYGEGEECDGC